MKYNLLTKYGETLDLSNVLKDYPRPQLKRESYYNINGIWNYDINSTGNIDCDFKQEIIVPFCIESELSKVRKDLKDNEFLIYKKEFVIEDAFLKEITLLHFEAVDQECYVYLNNQYIGENKNGYLPFYFDVTKYIKVGINTLIVKTKDPLDIDYPYGKQSKNRGGMWYTPVSGIWGSVWLESVNKGYIEDIKLTPNIDESLIRIQIAGSFESIKIQIYDKEAIIHESNTSEKEISITINNPKLWTPENPFLYKLKISSDSDTIESYFAMRKFHANEKHFLLNNKPYFVNGVLDQGYFSDGIYTPASYNAYIDDILSMKELGFNTLRKHIKIEPRIFYYYCDLYGMLVFQDMINVGKYSFFKDTFLPTLGFKKRIFNNVSKKQKENFIYSTKETIKHLYNHPSIVSYTIFNEGWGQFDAEELYDIVKNIDSTRVIDTTSGWFKSKKSDVESLHIYFRKLKFKKTNKPIFISEFGGYSYRIIENSFNEEKEYGYKKYIDKLAFQKGLTKLYKNEVLGNISKGLAGIIYTQLSDVEDETNGLLTYDRRICKLNKEEFKKINITIARTFENFS